jgi:hypothetical protein
MNPSRESCGVALEVEDFDLAIKELQETGVEFDSGP